MFQIEKDVPMPVSRSRYPFPQMKVGDSFFVPETHVPARLMSAAISYAKRNTLAWKFAARRIDGGVRIWRIK